MCCKKTQNIIYYNFIKYKINDKIYEINNIILNNSACEFNSKKAVKNSSDIQQDADLRNKAYFYNNFCYNFRRNCMIQQFSKLRNYKLRLSRNSFVHCDLICFSQRVTITVPVVSETLTRPRMDTKSILSRI